MSSFHKTWFAGCVILLGLASSPLRAGSHDGPSPWHCPYHTDCDCKPRRQLYGHYATKWSRWPGVDDTQYRSKSDREPRPYPEPPADTGPRLNPAEMMLPPTNLPTLDEAPRPPSREGDAMGPPSLFDEPAKEEEEPSILAPPEENVLDELLPPENKDPRNQPDSTPPRSLLPEEPAQPSNDGPKDEPKDEPKSDSKSDPFDGDPFLDDPLFDDDAPAPPKSSHQPSRALRGPKLTTQARHASRANTSVRTSAHWRKADHFVETETPAEATLSLGAVAEPNELGFGRREPASRRATPVAHWEAAEDTNRVDEAESVNELRANRRQATTAANDDFRVEPGQRPEESSEQLKWRANPLR